MLTFFKDDDVEPVLYIKLLLNLFVVKVFTDDGKEFRENQREREEHLSERRIYPRECINQNITNGPRTEQSRANLFFFSSVKVKFFLCGKSSLFCLSFPKNTVQNGHFFSRKKQSSVVSKKTLIREKEEEKLPFLSLARSCRK